MPVVINEFEVLSEPPAASAQTQGQAPAEGSPREQLEPHDVQLAWRLLQCQALRVWAH